MRRYLPQPVDAAVFHRGGWVEAFGDGLRDDRLTFFGQPLQQCLFLLDQRIDPRRLLIKESGDTLLGVEGWISNNGVLHRVLAKTKSASHRLP